MEASQLFQISNAVWLHFVTVDLSERSSVALVGRTGLEYYVKVDIGNEKLALLLGVNERIASQLASGMFACRRLDLDDFDLEDALGELANMLASKVMEAMHLSVTLGIPQHIAGASIDSFWDETQAATEVCALADDSPIYIAVITTE